MSERPMVRPTQSSAANKAIAAHPDARGRLIPLLLAASIGLVSCTLLFPFSPEGLRCDEGRCADGYRCAQGICVAGERAGCELCAPHEWCRPQTGTCVPNTCANRRCAAGERCLDEDGGVRCEALRIPALGHPCSSDAECRSSGPARVCVRGALRGAPLGPHLGLCLERCETIGAACASSGLCRSIPRPSSTTEVLGVCLPTDAAVTCRTSEDCADDGLVCGAFVHATLPPLRLCDAAVLSGARPGELCGVTSALFDAGNPCRASLCAPTPADRGQPSTCLESCEVGTCPADSSCLPTEITIDGTLAAPLACIPTRTECASCGLAPTPCGPDAPHCTPLAPGGSRACLRACTPDGGLSAACPADRVCTQVSAGVHRCLPPSGQCPP